MAKKKRFRSYYFLWISYYFCYTWISYYFLWSYERSLTFFKNMSIQKNQQTQLKQTFQKKKKTYIVLDPQKIRIIIPSQGWRVFGCPKSTFDLVAKVEEDIKELEAYHRREVFFFRWGEMRCWKPSPVVSRRGFFFNRKKRVGGDVDLKETSLES